MIFLAVGVIADFRSALRDREIVVAERRLTVEDSPSGLIDASELPRSAAACPTCLFDWWNCKRTTCKPGYAGRMVWGYYFDWTYWTAPCYEEIPKNATAIMVDRDVLCMFPEYNDQLTCEHMKDYVFIGARMWEGCEGDSANDVIHEACGWICKNGRPAIRCEYTFDKTGVHRFENRVDFCYVEGKCQASGIELRLVVCNGTELAHKYDHLHTVNMLDANFDGDMEAALSDLATLMKENAVLENVLDGQKENTEVLRQRIAALNKHIDQQALHRADLEEDLEQERESHDTTRTTYLVVTIIFSVLVITLAGSVWYYKNATKLPPVFVVTDGQQAAGSAVMASDSTVVMGRSVAAPHQQPDKNWPEPDKDWPQPTTGHVQRQAV